MANTLHKNTIYIDSTGSFTVDAVTPILYKVIITPSAANSVVKIRETNSSGKVKFHYVISTADSREVNLTVDNLFLVQGAGIQLTSTFYIDTLTNISSVILIGSWLAPAGRART